LKKQKKLTNEAFLEEIKKLKAETFSEVVFLKDISQELFTFGIFFLSIPNDFFDNGQVRGKNWEATKDLCKWHGYRKSIFVPLVADLATAWANNIKKEKSS